MKKNDKVKDDALRDIDKLRKRLRDGNTKTGKHQPHDMDVHRAFKELKDRVGSALAEIDHSEVDASAAKEEILAAARAASDEAPPRHSEPMHPPAESEQ